jgi:hypothetical protein
MRKNKIHRTEVMASLNTNSSHLVSSVVGFFWSGKDIVARLVAPGLSDYDPTNFLSTPPSAPA